MSRIVSSFLLVGLLGAALGGCGLVQSVTDTTRSTAQAIFYKQVRTLHLDFTARAALNTEQTDMRALSVPTMVRVYQLRDRTRLEAASYEGLLEDGETVLGEDLLDARRVVVKPEAGVRLDVPMDEQAQFVAVVALFRVPDTRQNNWRLVLARSELDPDRPRVIELGDNRLSVRELEGK